MTFPIPNGWRKIKNGEKIISGDYFHTTGEDCLFDWCPYNRLIGMAMCESMSFSIRRKNPNADLPPNSAIIGRSVTTTPSRSVVTNTSVSERVKKYLNKIKNKV